MKEEEEDKTTKEKLYEVFKELIILVETPEMRKRTLNVFYSWLVVAMVYYGLSFNTKNLGGNRYVSVFISGFVEVRTFKAGALQEMRLTGYYLLSLGACGGGHPAPAEHPGPCQVLLWNFHRRRNRMWALSPLHHVDK